MVGGRSGALNSVVALHHGGTIEGENGTAVATPAVGGGQAGAVQGGDVTRGSSVPAG